MQAFQAGRHLSRWTERIPGGTLENDGLETGIMGGYGREISVDTRTVLMHEDHRVRHEP